MQTSKRYKQSQILSVTLLVIPILFFVLILRGSIPYASFTRFFYSYTPPLFFLILFLYYFSFRLPGRWGWLIGITLTATLFALALSFKWTSGFSDNGVIGGILPYKDGKNYYNGAQMILSGLSIPRYGQAAWRPLLSGLLATLLLFTNQNLQWVLAILVGLTGVGCYWSARQVFHTLGAPAAAVFMALLYLYIQPKIGYALSELPGLTFGCLGFILLWKAAQGHALREFLFGLVVLAVALSIRAGALFVFPLMVLWAGWFFRGERRFSWRVAGITTGTVLVAYLSATLVFGRLVGAPSYSSFGSFSYTLYGQVLGGAGWHRAMEDLGTLDPTIVYRAAFQFFLNHPLSLLIGVVKSYRDFFLPGGLGIFVFVPLTGMTWLDTVLWVIALLLTIWGLVRVVQRVRSPLPALLVASFVGIFLSIPFLPPVDGGARFYAGTMPFFYVLPAIVISELFQGRGEWLSKTDEKLPTGPVYAISTLLLILTVVAPVFIRVWGGVPTFITPACMGEQVPFVVRVNPGSYLDLIPTGAASCGLVPETCLADFQANGSERSIDDFYQELESLALSSKSITRIVPANDLIEEKFHYFVGTSDQLQSHSFDRLVSGCATEILTQNQTIYKVESVDSSSLPSTDVP